MVRNELFYWYYDSGSKQESVLKHLLIPIWIFLCVDYIMRPMYESGENYLETIYRLHQETGFVRSIDVARKLEVSKPSVSRAMGILKDDDYIVFGAGGEIILTDKGLERAKGIYSRHVLLTDFLVLVSGVNHEIAERNACRIEHVVDDDVIQGIRHFLAEGAV